MQHEIFFFVCFCFYGFFFSLSLRASTSYNYDFCWLRSMICIHFWVNPSLPSLSLTHCLRSLLLRRTVSHSKLPFVLWLCVFVVIDMKQCDEYICTHSRSLSGRLVSCSLHSNPLHSTHTPYPIPPFPYSLTPWWSDCSLNLKCADDDCPYVSNPYCCGTVSFFV